MCDYISSSLKKNKNKKNTCHLKDNFRQERIQSMSMETIQVQKNVSM